MWHRPRGRASCAGTGGDHPGRGPAADVHPCQRGCVRFFPRPRRQQRPRLPGDRRESRHGLADRLVCHRPVRELVSGHGPAGGHGPARDGHRGSGHARPRPGRQLPAARGRRARPGRRLARCTCGSPGPRTAVTCSSGSPACRPARPAPSRKTCTACNCRAADLPGSQPKRRNSPGDRNQRERRLGRRAGGCVPAELTHWQAALTRWPSLLRHAAHAANGALGVLALMKTPVLLDVSLRRGQNA
jgi:hypothetical protein